MSIRKVLFVNGEFYHIYNRGVDKRNIFSDTNDINRFFKSMNEFNTLEPIGSLYENSFKHTQLGGSTAKLVGSRSSWREYVGKTGENIEDFCKKDIILGQYKNRHEYKDFAESSLKDIIERKSLKKELEGLLLE